MNTPQAWGQVIEPAPSSLGKYRLVAPLGRGGMARAVLAMTEGPGGFNKLTVLKILHAKPSRLAEQGAAAFFAEARLAARLLHPNVVQTYEAAQIDDNHVIAMEYLQGQTYRAAQLRAQAQGWLPVYEHLRILSEVARGLHYAHTLTGFDGAPLGIVHCDVSPQNVFITYDGQVKLLDFGIAQTRDSKRTPSSGTVRGKFDYMAPEQLRDGPVDARADVFALGAMLWEAITGARFAGNPDGGVLGKARNRLQGAEPCVRMLQPDVPAALARIVDSALELEPSHRLVDAASFADGIDAYLEEVDARCSAKTLSTWMNSMFSKERDQTRTLIELHLGEYDREPSDYAVTIVQPCRSTVPPPREQPEPPTRAPRDVLASADLQIPSALELPTAISNELLVAAGIRAPLLVTPRLRVIGSAALMILGALAGAALAWFTPESSTTARALGVAAQPAQLPAAASYSDYRPTTGAIDRPLDSGLKFALAETCVQQPVVAPLVRERPLFPKQKLLAASARAAKPQPAPLEVKAAPPQDTLIATVVDGQLELNPYLR